MTGIVVPGAAARTHEVVRIADDPPPVGQANPDQIDYDPCVGNYQRPGGPLVEPDNEHLAFCGSSAKDKMLSKRGHDWIDASDGNDLINAKGNHWKDFIWGGGGRDTAILDRGDTTRGVERCKFAKKFVVCPKAPTARRLAALADTQALEFPFSPPTVECVVEDGQRLVRFSREPVMRGPNVTRLTDWQYVAWRAFLLRYDGTAWVHVLRTDWLWDKTTDTQFDSMSPFSGNYWRRFDTSERWHYWFIPGGPGAYRVAISYYWYPNTLVPEHREYAWAGPHAGPFEDPFHAQQYCYFPS